MRSLAVLVTLVHINFVFSGGNLFPCENYIADSDRRRDLIKLVQNDYHEKNKDEFERSFSLGFGMESEWVNPHHLAKKPVVYFGSGPDLLRPIFNHPYSEEYVFIDSFQGWGEGPEYLTSEIIKRISHLESFVEEIHRVEGEPLSFNFRFKGSRSYQKIRFIRENYHNYKRMLKVFNSIESEWAGVLVSGAPIPRRAVLLETLKRIGKGGVFVHSRWPGIDRRIRRKFFNSLARVTFFGKSLLGDLLRVTIGSGFDDISGAGMELIITARNFDRFEHITYSIELSTYAFFKR